MPDAVERVRAALATNQELVGGSEGEIRSKLNDQEEKINQLQEQFKENGDVLPLLREFKANNDYLRSIFEPQPPTEPGRREDPVPSDAIAKASQRDREEREEAEKKAAAPPAAAGRK